MPDVLCQHSEAVLWNLCCVQMFFWWTCRGESGLPILFLCHLRTTHAGLQVLDPLRLRSPRTEELTLTSFNQQSCKHNHSEVVTILPFSQVPRSPYLMLHQRIGELRFIMLVSPEELTLQALRPEQRGYRVFIYRLAWLSGFADQTGARAIAKSRTKVSEISSSS